MINYEKGYRLQWFCYQECPSSHAMINNYQSSSSQNSFRFPQGKLKVKDVRCDKVWERISTLMILLPGTFALGAFAYYLSQGSCMNATIQAFWENATISHVCQYSILQFLILSHFNVQLVWPQFSLSTYQVCFFWYRRLSTRISRGKAPIKLNYNFMLLTFYSLFLNA